MKQTSTYHYHPSEKIEHCSTSGCFPPPNILRKRTAGSRDWNKQTSMYNGMRFLIIRQWNCKNGKAEG